MEVVSRRWNLKNNVFVVPYHPSNNGQPERMVQNVKNAFKNMIGKDIFLKLSCYLISLYSKKVL